MGLPAKGFAASGCGLGVTTCKGGGPKSLVSGWQAKKTGAAKDGALLKIALPPLGPGQKAQAQRLRTLD